MPAFSLRLRLTLLWSAVSLVVLLGLEVLALAVLSAQLIGEVDRNLALQARQYQQDLTGAIDETDLQRRATAFLATDSDAGSGLAAAYVVRFEDGMLVTNTPDTALQATITAARPQAGVPVTVHDPRRGDLRVAVIAIEQQGRPVADLRIALPLASAETTVGNLLTPMLVTNVLMIGLGGVLAYALLGGGLAPIRAITAAAASISEGDLSRRIGYRGPRDEVGRLAGTFDAMLARLQSGFEQRQAFYSLASHELRTPLTIVRGHLEVLRRTEKPDQDEIRETLDVALEELARITDDVNDMLLLGRMLLGQPGAMEHIDAGTVLREAHRRARGLAVRDWQLEIAGPAPVQADAEQLTRALLNLVTNAVRFTREGDRVKLACRNNEAYVRLEVADSGQGIRHTDLPHVFAPWYRVGARDGSVGGLGLLIVREVALAHGGDVEVTSREGAGTTFTIRLPLAPPSGARTDVAPAAARRTTS